MRYRLNLDGRDLGNIEKSIRYNILKYYNMREERKYTFTGIVFSDNLEEVTYLFSKRKDIKTKDK